MKVTFLSTLLFVLFSIAITPKANASFFIKHQTKTISSNNQNSTSELKCNGENKTQKNTKHNSNDKSFAVAIILCVFLGYLGIHRFYLGYTGLGLLELFTIGGLGVLWLVDLVRICFNELQPKNGKYYDCEN